MNNSNLPQNFEKGNSLPQSPALIVSSPCATKHILGTLPFIKLNAATALFAVAATLFLTILIDHK